MKKIYENSFPSIVIALAIIIATIIGAYTFYNVRSLDNTLSVTGSTKQTVKADLTKWSITTNLVVGQFDISSAYNKVSDNAAKIKAFLIKNGVQEKQISMSPIFNDDYYGSNNARQVNVRQIITVNSNEVDRIKTISENMTALSQQGVIFSPSSPEYSVSKLPEYRISLIGKAVEDAKARATEIAKSMDQSVGKMKSAASGVVQVLQLNSNEVSDYGSYDTSTIDKDVMLTVRVTFLLK